MDDRDLVIFLICPKKTLVTLMRLSRNALSPKAISFPLLSLKSFIASQKLKVAGVSVSGQVTIAGSTHAFASAESQFQSIEPCSDHLCTISKARQVTQSEPESESKRLCTCLRAWAKRIWLSRLWMTQQKKDIGREG